MNDPVTAASTAATAASTAAEAGLMGLLTVSNIKWVLGGGLLIYIVKVIYNAGRSTEALETVVADVAEIKENQKKTLNCTQGNAKEIAVLKTEIKNLKEAKTNE